jgi:hypothetical protein
MTTIQQPDSGKHGAHQWAVPDYPGAGPGYAQAVAGLIARARHGLARGTRQDGQPSRTPSTTRCVTAQRVAAARFDTSILV